MRKIGLLACVLAGWAGCAPQTPFPGHLCPRLDSDFSYEPPQRCGVDRLWDVHAWLAAHGGARSVTPTSQSGQADPAPFADPTGSTEVAQYRAAWEDVIGPVPRSDLPLEPCQETPALSQEQQAEVDFSAYRMTRVTYRGAHGAFIPAYLLVPQRSGPLPAVVVAHQALTACGKDEPAGICPQGAQNLAFARSLAELGLITLAPDDVGYGERARCGPLTGLDWSDAEPLLARFPGATEMGLRISDVGRAIDYLQGLPEVAPDRIGILGHSNGGIDALFAAAFDPRLRCAVSNAGPNLVRREVLPFAGLAPGVARWAGFGYMPAMGFFSPGVAVLPVEVHQLYAMVAPRGLFLSLMEDDSIAPVFDRIAFAMDQAGRAFAALGGDFAYHTIASGRTPECVARYGVAACSRDHGWYPETEALAFPWLIRCLSAP